MYDDDSGKVEIALTSAGSMSAFLRRADGTLLVAATDGSAYVSKPDGTSFSKLSGAPHLRGLGERDAAAVRHDGCDEGWIFGRRIAR